MRILCLSDLHGHLPAVPDADLLLLGGDYCPMRRPHDQFWWLRDSFCPWLEGIAERMPVVGVAGNHDFLFEQLPERVPPLPWTYLQDSEATVAGLRIWGSPWQPRFFDWAFNLDETELAAKWAMIPEGVDVVLLHGPPRDYGDLSPISHTRTGSPSLTARLREVRPRLVVCGHIHAGRGVYAIDTNPGTTITVVNAAHVDEQYEPANEAVAIELAVVGRD